MTHLAESTSGAQAVIRALRILKLFDGKQTHLSLQHVIGESGLNRTTVFRLLSTLVDEGFLNRHADGRYQLGPALTALGGLANRRDNLRQIAHPILQELVNTTGERATLEIPVTGADGHTAMLVIDEIAGVHRLGINEFAGNHLPIYATSTGKALMAFLPKARIEKILAQPMAAFTSKTPVTKQALEKDLARVKKHQYALVQEELEEGLVAVGAPIFDSNGEVCAAICIAGPTIRMTADRLPSLTRYLQDSARLISESIGFKD
ncbi:MAG: DNA-binding IclR family transcriptional regulator [Candidatus Promineifilaceae bacterium]